MRDWIVLAGIALMIPFAGVVARAQASSARVSGIVEDAKGAIVPGARLTLTETSTNLSRRTITSGSGAYSFPSLDPGAYIINATAPGFSEQSRKFQLEVNQALRLDWTLRVGALSQTVEVVAAAQTLRTSDATLGEVIEPSLVHDLPLNGRHILSLALLAAGAHQGFGAQSGQSNPLYWRPQQNSALSVGGARPNANYFLLDGSVDTDPTFNTQALSPSPDSVEEFKVQTGSYSAEFGDAGGAQINIVTKSGGNQIHGDAYEFVRSSSLDARTFTDPSHIPHLAQNNFGASLGGPIQRNKTFFFMNYEEFRLSNGISQIDTVPTAAERAGDFSETGERIYDPSTSAPNPSFNPALPSGPSNPQTIRQAFANNMIPSQEINGVSSQVLAYVPLPNISKGAAVGMGGAGPDSNNYLDLRTNRNYSDQGTIRIDRILPHGDAIFGRYTFEQERDFTPQNLPGFGAFDDNLAQNLTVSYTHIISHASVNVAWFGLSRLSMHRYSQNNFTHDYVSQLGIQGVGYGGKGAWGMPWFAIQGYSGMGDSFAATPVQDWDTVYQAGDIVNREIGRHSLQFGGDFRYFYWPMWGFFENRGFYQFTNGFTTRTASNDGTGSALASFLLGLPAVKQRQAGIPVMDLQQWFASAFIEDIWRLTGRTTLDLGLRYEYTQPLWDTDNPNSNIVFRNGKPYFFIGGQLGMPEGLVYANRLNFAPRFGFAHVVGGRLKLVLRGGFGVFYTPVDANTWCNQRHQPPLVFAETDQSNNYIPSLAGFNFAAAALGQTVISYAATQLNPPPQYVNQWSFSVQKALPGNTVIEVGYQGSRGFHLQRAHLINNAPPGPGAINPRRPYQTIGFLPGTIFPASFPIESLSSPVSAINYLENSAQSWYDAGWVDVRHPLGHGLALLSNFTWSKNLTNAPDFRSPMDEAAIPQNNNGLDAEKGLGCDVPLRFVASVVYAVPGWKRTGWLYRLTGNWSLASIFQAQSGLPFTISVFGDTANAGTLLGENPIRADVTGQPVFPAGTHTSSQWFNPAAFALPPAYQFGDAGRNSLQGPGLQTMDVAFTREFRPVERIGIQVRAEFFNALNHTNYMTPNRYVNEAQFGTITMAQTPGREVQLGARLTF
ncbi:MAG: carboxypeptidase regulatory-like domain-containing protein [Acidobacteriota bacterium]|nr:carboxypeptidase regulatory-like domain-containing protein [Acidobacteriota bacterium]